MSSSLTASAILAHSVTVSTKHFDCFSPSSNLGEPTVTGYSRGVRRLVWDQEAESSTLSIPTMETVTNS